MDENAGAQIGLPVILDAGGTASWCRGHGRGAGGAVMHHIFALPQVPSEPTTALDVPTSASPTLQCSSSSSPSSLSVPAFPIQKGEGGAVEANGQR